MSESVAVVVVIVMGVSGSGKSTVGRLLAERVGWPFVDGDDYHPPANIEKMRAGLALTDEDRQPWLETLAGIIAGMRDEERSIVLGCSALKRSYRDTLTGGRRHDVLLVHLAGEPDVLRPRMEARAHFMPAANLEGQLETLEPPSDDEHALTIEVLEAPAAIAGRIMAELERRFGRVS